MDKLIYIAMTGAKHAMYRQTSIANNLANVKTPGFRAEFVIARAAPVLGEGAPTRTFALAQTAGADFSPGGLESTGRDLDIALLTAGFIAVQTPSGEAYTRNGSLEIDSTGLLHTREGFPVLGDGGPITIPENSIVTIAADGTINAAAQSDPAQVNEVGRLKLVDVSPQALERGSDGLFRLRNGQTADVSENVRITSGALEASNVNAVAQLVNMINVQRHYDMHIRLLQAADQNARQAAQILNFS